MNLKTDPVNRLLIILYCFIPFALISGPFLPDLFVSIIGITFLVKVILDENYKLFKNKIIIIFFIFCLLITVRSLFAENIKLSVLSSSFYFRFGLFSLCIYFLLKENVNFIFILKNILVIIVSILFIDTIFQFYFGKNIIGLEYNNQNFRLTSFFGKDEVLGSYLSRLFPFLISLILFEEFYLKKKNKNFIFIFLIIIFLTTIFLSGERTAFILILISLILIFLSCKNLRKNFVYAILIASLVLTSILLINPKIKDRMIGSVVKQLGLTKESERIVIFSKTYEGHYKIAINMFKEKPLIGHGVKMFRVYCKKPENFVQINACTTHPHNIYMQFLAELGIFGFIFILLIFISITYIIFKNIYYQIFFNKQIIPDHKAAILVFYFITLFPFAPSGNFFNNWLSIIYFLPAGYLLYLKDNND